ITGGLDSSLFTIDTNTNELKFINPPDFEVPGDNNGDNVYEVEVSASDGVNTTPQTISVSVSDVNDNSPVISGNPSTSISKNTAYSFIPTANDSDANDTLTFSISNAPSWANFNTVTGELSGTPDNDGVGTTTGIVISVSDGNETVNLTAFDLTVEDKSNPIFTSDANLSVMENTTTVTKITATDPDGDIPTYSITGGADSSLFTINTNTGEFSFNSAPNFEEPSDTDSNNVYEVEVTADDGNGGVIAQTLSVSVMDAPDAPVISGNPSSSVSQDNAYSFIPTTIDPDVSDTLTFSIINAPSWASFNTNTGELSGTPGNDDVGTTTGIVISVSDGNETVSLSAFDLNVTMNAQESPPGEGNANDTDNDGIDDDIETSVGDGNKDGVPDNQQSNVASNGAITIFSRTNTTINSVTTTANNPPNNSESEGITFPVGVTDFTLQGLTNGETTTVNLLLPEDQAYNTFWKYGKTPDNNQDHWYEFLYDGETGAEFIDTDDDGKADQIVLHFVDGKRGDSDLTANGVIVNQGTPGVTNTSLGLSKSTSQNIWNIEGDVGAGVANFSLVSTNTTQVNEVGFFKLDTDNRVNGIAPGEAGFAEAVLQQGEVIFSALSDDLFNDVDLTRKMQVGAGEKLAFYFVSDGTADGALINNSFDNVFFSINEANANGEDYLEITEVNGVYTLNWREDNFTSINQNTSNSSFDDLVMQFQLENAPLTTQNLIGNYQGEQEGELIDLQTFTGREVKATFTVEREADFDNFVGLYKVNDIEGTITDELTGEQLKPGDAGYSELIVRQRIVGVDLSVADNQSVTVEDTLEGGSLFATFMIVNGNPDSLNGDFSQVYTSYIMGNSDQTEHIRLLGDNTFGFEDLANGGDNDFNDVIIKANFQIL
ncbi:MAG: choice-of-anchor U domain-containing protein, partial [Cyanobacteria bacterium P01_A01_bin.80]